MLFPMLHSAECSTVRNLVMVVALLLAAGCVSGYDVIGPGDPQYQTLCVDSTSTDTTTVCWQQRTTITIHIENPNPPDSI